MWFNTFSAILAGFSAVCALILLFAYLFFLQDMRKTLTGKCACSLILGGLFLLQVAHFHFFFEGAELLKSRVYCTLLVLIPSSFFFFSREVLFPKVTYRWFDALHWLPLFVSLILPIKFVPAFAFLFGTAYTFWFTRIIYKLKDQRGRFKFEMFFFGMFAAMALLALLLGLFLPYINADIFYYIYSNAISIATILIVSALLIFPELLSDIMLITELTYAKSKLNGVDVNEKSSQLNQLMLNDNHFENEDLSLSMVAELLDLSSHQLSELINTQFGQSFPRYIRDHRVQAAKTLLRSESKLSVLSISMMTGFKSQSSFYTAFKEATGESPGTYRHKHQS